jgi:AraC-like DNA-binding protein
MQNKEMKNLTELSYENLFYDQSHFIRDFKELTKITPSVFFEKVNTEQNNIWMLI